MKLSKAQRAALPKSAFLDEERREFPVQDHAHWVAAGMEIDKAEGYDAADRKRLRAKWERVGQAHDWLKEKAVKDALEALTDAFEPEEIEVIEDAQDKPLRVRLLLTKANVKNGNRRVYPRDVLQAMVDEAQTTLKREALTMEWEHPATKRDERGRVVGYQSNPERFVSVIDALYMRGDRVYQDTTILDTAQGRAIAAMIRAGKRPPVSLRALGSTRPGVINGQPANIATRLKYRGSDWVSNPALPEAGPEEVLTDAQIAEALDSAKEENTMDELEQLKSQLLALTDAKEEDSAKVKELESKIEKLEMERDKLKLEGKKEDSDKEVKDALATVAALSAQVKALTDAQEAEKAAKKTEANKSEVKALVDSLESHADLTRFNGEMKREITARVARAADKATAEQALTDAIADMDRAIAAANLAAKGFKPQAEGRTTPHVQVTDNPKPWMAVIDKMDEAFNDYRRTANVPQPDRSLREANQPFVDELIQHVEAVEGKALTDSAQSILDGNSILDSANPTNLGALFNQPTILTAILVQQFWQQEALQFVQGIGPAGFERNASLGNGRIGSVLRVPVETFSDASGASNLPYFDDLMASAESAAINEMNIDVNWLSFLPAWKKLAFRLTGEAEAQLLNGPLNYNAMARLMFNLTNKKARVIDRALYEEMIQTSTEYAAVAIANEAVAAGNWTYVSGGSSGGYGSNVVGVAQLQCGGTSAAPNKGVPVVRPRAQSDLNAQGQLVVGSTKNAITIAVSGGPTQVEGYLDGNGVIQSKPGTTATYAVDYVNGKVCFTSGSGVSGSTLPTISYSYETNYDTFNISNPVLQTGETLAMYYNKLLQQIDASAALMGSAPRYVVPDLALMSLNVATYIQNAQIFYQWVSPNGSQLKNPKIKSNAKFAERSGIEFAKINTPWSAVDRRIMLMLNGSTKYGVDTPFQIQGPYPSYDPASGQVKDEKICYGRENSVICTPQVTNQAGTVLNPVSRSILLV